MANDGWLRFWLLPGGFSVLTSCAVVTLKFEPTISRYSVIGRQFQTGCFPKQFIASVIVAVLIFPDCIQYFLYSSSCFFFPVVFFFYPLLFLSCFSRTEYFLLLFLLFLPRSLWDWWFGFQHRSDNGWQLNWPQHLIVTALDISKDAYKKTGTKPSRKLLFVSSTTTSSVNDWLTFQTSH